MKKNIVRLTESELKTMIKEAVTKIIKESSCYSDTVEVELYYLEFSNPQLDEFFEDANCPESVSVEIKYDIEPYDEGDYWTPPSGGDVNIYSFNIDIDGKFKEIIPAELYDSFVQDVETYLNEHSDDYCEQLYDSYENYEPDYEDYYD
jgi:hypothetical protein